MLTAKQISVRLVNKPGRLSLILAALAKEKVELIALSVMGAGNRSTLRFVPDDPALAEESLETISVGYETDDVLVTTVSSQSGAFRKICERLAAEHLNIEYAYGSCSTKGGKDNARAVIKVNNLAKAQRVLSVTTPARHGRVKSLRRRPVHAR